MCMCVCVIMYMYVIERVRGVVSLVVVTVETIAVCSIACLQLQTVCIS